jgi:hypothetical protein
MDNITITKKSKSSKMLLLIISAAALAVLLFFFVIRPLTALSTGNYKVYINTYNIKEFEVKNGVTEIKNEAFRDCDSLERISILHTVTSIGSNAFKGCHFSEFAIHANATGATKDVQIVADTVRVFGDAGSIVHEDAFSNLTYFTKLIFEEGISQIHMTSLKNPRGGVEVHLPSTLDSIYSDSFSQLYIDKLFLHADATDATKELKGRVYNIIVVGDGKSSVSSYAFSSFTDVKSLTVGSGVTDLGSYLFSESTRNLDVYISKDFKSFSRHTFADPTAYVYEPIGISNIYYEGNVRDWKNIANCYYAESVAYMNYHCQINY